MGRFLGGHTIFIRTRATVTSTIVTVDHSRLKSGLHKKLFSRHFSPSLSPDIPPVFLCNKLMILSI